MADDKAMEAAKARVAEGKAAADKTREAQEAASAGKPTPTQEENDLAKCGAYIGEHEPDGSPVASGEPQTKHAEPKRGAPYQTRAARPAES